MTYERKKTGQSIRRLLPLLPVLALVWACSNSFDNADEFPGPWVYGVSPGIERVLEQHNVHDCLRAAYRPSKDSEGPLDPRGVFLVYCQSPENADWVSWIVRPELTQSEALMGPDPPRPNVPPPVG